MAKHTSAASPLLRLPPELRNKIYQLVIVKHESIHIDKTTFNNHQPSLLRTCCAIRNEAVKIFYAESQFSITVEDWDASLLQRLDELLKTHGVQYSSDCALNTHGDPSWRNLLQWLEHYYADGGSSLRQPVMGEDMQYPTEVAKMEVKIIGAAFSIVKKCRGMPWKDVLRLVETQHIILEYVDKRWA